MTKVSSRTSARAIAAALALAAGAGSTAACGEPRPAGGGGGEDHVAEAGLERREEDHDHHETEGDGGVVELGPEAIERIGLETVRAALRSLDERRSTTGEVGFDEERLAHVAPRVTGRLTAVPAELGEEVAAGEVLAVLDSVELGEAKAAYLRSRAHDEVARLSFERQRSLHADRIVPEQAVLEAEGAAREAAADLAGARETLRLLGLEAEEIEGLTWGDPRPSEVAVRAPFAGRVVEREATTGELVTPEHELFTLADLSQVWVWIDVYERDLARVRLGDRAEVRLDAHPGVVFVGEVGYLGDRVDAATRTVRGRVDLPNPHGRLKPGMFARVALAASASEGEDDGAARVLAIPRSAVQRDGGEAIVFVRLGPGRFERREVRLGRATDEEVEVLSGLEAGDEVVTEGAFLLKSQASADELGGHHH